MKKLSGILSTIVMVIILVFAFLLVGVRLFGMEPYTVLSGSMEPNYHVGSLIYVVKVDTDELKVDDPITFVMNDGTVVTHRIIEVLSDEEDPTVRKFRTQGDNNDTPDGSPVHEQNVIGKPVFTIPLLGYISFFIQNPPGSYVVIGLVAAFFILAFMPDLLEAIFGSDKNNGEGDTPSGNSDHESRDR